MNNRLSDACARELESFLEALFENPVRIPGTWMAEIPVIGGLFAPDLDNYSGLLPHVIAALCARERFRQDAPGWPTLPLRLEDCDELENADDPRTSVLGLFGNSLRGESWDPRHPRFAPFVAGLLACRHTPGRIRHDRALLQEFPPTKLKGMCGGWLSWRSPETLAQDRRMRKMVAAADARRAHAPIS